MLSLVAARYREKVNVMRTMQAHALLVVGHAGKFLVMVNRETCNYINCLAHLTL